MVSCLQAAPAQTADPVEDAKKADEQRQKTIQENEEDLAAARRARELALNENERAENSVKELDKVVAALRRQWLQEFQADNSEKATEAETKLEKAKQELKEAKQELKEAKQELENAETKLEKAKQECKAQAGAQACRGFCVALEKCQP
ncbi:unnamed protein product [Symbiodinium pilosum]|uniref:Uncharacterized protein n=1 Tax=Symbiodinium pilosum TaxID=2952 RepID=A0A812W1C5_SYMPI|nr:unnamed protein product [Symbiodinium pilosum]